MSGLKVMIPVESVEHLIVRVRGQRVLLDNDLARMYGVRTSGLNRAVKRNAGRFPPDFMFRLTDEEASGLMCQIGTSNGRGGRRTLPFAFTEHGVAMLSSVLRSDRATLVNIAIMRAFIRTREIVATQQEISRKLSELERRVGTHDEAIQGIFAAIRQLVNPPRGRGPKRIGFHGTR
ncbi:MAG: ORF6N domain-containing protein [Planctomycetota bacterium]